MKPPVVLPSLLLLSLAMACQSGPPVQPASAAQPAASASRPAPTAAANEDDAAAAKEREKREDVEKLVGKLAGRASEESSEKTALDVVIDAATGRRLQRIPKSSQYFASGGRLYNSVVRDESGVPIVREDAAAYYVDAPSEDEERGGTPAPPRREEAHAPVIEVSAEEAEVVEPPVSKIRLRLEETSEGLPTSGFWRENFALADLDGDGRPEIAAPPPRLSGLPIQIFKLEGKSWRSVKAAFDDPDQVGAEYGGIAAGDLDGDGRVDLVYVQHGRGPAVARNLGDFRFRIEGRGLARGVSGRSVAIGDLDGDGKPDVLSLSDEPEYLKVRQSEREGNFLARYPRSDGFVPGYDVRAFLARGDRFEENHDGLDEACFGFTLGLSAAPEDGGAPFFASGCRYQGATFVVYEFDRSEKKFRRAGLDFAERYSFHSGTAIGTYQGHPAAFMSYVKVGPATASRNISGHGVSVYYREKGVWKRKRVVKFVGSRAESQGIGAGDLNGDGLTDVAFADDSLGRLRIFFQTREGGFEELAAELEPAFVNRSSAVRIGDIDGDGRQDIALMYQFATGTPTKSGGLRVFRNAGTR